jgi:hypothetical protein
MTTKNQSQDISTISIPDLLSMLVKEVRSHADPQNRGNGEPFTQREIKSEIERRFDELKAAASAPGLHVHYWDTDIGQGLALAPDAATAREKVIATITRDDAVYEEFCAAVSGDPVIVREPIAVFAWHP